MKKLIDFICLVVFAAPTFVISYVAHWVMAGWATGEYCFDPDTFDKKYTKVKR